MYPHSHTTCILHFLNLLMAALNPPIAPGRKSPGYFFGRPLKVLLCFMEQDALRTQHTGSETSALPASLFNCVYPPLDQCLQIRGCFHSPASSTGLSGIKKKKTSESMQSHSKTKTFFEYCLQTRQLYLTEAITLFTK